MAEDLVMRSIYLPEIDDAELRQIAYEQKVSKSDLIRAAVRRKLAEWRADESKATLRDDIVVGLREIDRQAEVGRMQPPTVNVRPKATKAGVVPESISEKVAVVGFKVARVDEAMSPGERRARARARASAAKKAKPKAAANH